MKGLGLIEGTFCPHYNGVTRGVPRRREFRKMIRKTTAVGIAVESNCAIVLVDGRFYRIVRSKHYARAYRVFRSRQQVIGQQIRLNAELAPLKSLYAS